MPTTHRRQFLKSAGAAALTVPLFNILGRTARADDKKLGFAVVGLGSLATNQIAPALQKTKNCRLAAIVTGTPAKAEKWKEKYKIADKNIYNYETFDKIADNSDIDVVYVVLPNAMHGEYTIRAAKAGKHVLSEKPMEVSVAKCQAMVDACKAAKRMLAVGYRCRFVPHHLEAMRLAKEKVFGDLKFIHSSFGFKIGDPTQWRLKKALAGGGALMDVGIYSLQAACYISGEQPVEIMATESKLDKEKFKEVDESIAWSMKFPSGLIANCATTYATNGMNYAWAGADNGFIELTDCFSYAGVKGRTSKGPMDLPQVDHFATEMDDFADCIMNNKPTRAPGEMGVEDVRTMTAIYESIAQGKMVKARN
jgi:predicted dehydrogenase